MKPVRTTAKALRLRSLPKVEPSTDTGLRLLSGQVGAAYGQTFDGRWWWVVAPNGAAGWCSAAHLADADALLPAKPKPPGWRLASSLLTLRGQVDARAPQRSRTHDGTIGDAAHASRKSDHNPNGAGVVTAIDLTHDPAGGLDCAALADALVKSRDPRIKYIIFRGRIASSKVQPWTWRPYTGANRHDKHLHLSVDAGPSRYDDPGKWGIG